MTESKDNLLNVIERHKESMPDQAYREIVEALGRFRIPVQRQKFLMHYTINPRCINGFHDMGDSIHDEEDNELFGETLMQLEETKHVILEGVYYNRRDVPQIVPLGRQVDPDRIFMSDRAPNKTFSAQFGKIVFVGTATAVDSFEDTTVIEN